MATSGSFNTSSVGNFYFTFSWYRTGYDSASNVNYIHYTLTAHNTPGNYRTVYLKNLYINGSQVFYESGSSSSGKAYYDGNTVTSGDFTVQNSTSAGDGSVSASFEAGVGSYPGSNCSGNGSWDLDRIPRYATSVQSLSSKTSSSITMSWSSDSTIDYIWYSKDNGSSWTAVGSVNASSGSYTIPSLSANATYNIKTRVRRKDSQLTTDSNALSVTTYQKTIVSISLASKTSSSITISSSCNVATSSIKYRIKVSGGSYGSYQTSTTFSGLSANTTYVVQVYAVGQASGEASSAEVTVTTYQTTTVTLSLSSRTSSSITVSHSCNVATSSVQYRIKVSGGSYGNYQSSATFSGLSANTTYIVQVYVVAQASGEAGSSTVTATTYQTTVASISLSSKTVNSVIVTSSCNVTVSSTQYRIKTSGGSYGNYQSSATFSGLSANTAYVVEVKKVGQASGESGTATLNVTTYDYAKITSYPAFNLGSNEIIQYSNPSGSSAYISLYDKINDTFGNVICDYRITSGSSYTFNMTDAELDTLYKLFGNSNTRNIWCYIRTECNNSSYYDRKEITVTLTGNQKTGHLNINGTYKRSKRWLNINGVWKRSIRWLNINGTWKKTI